MGKQERQAQRRAARKNVRKAAKKAAYLASSRKEGGGMSNQTSYLVRWGTERTRVCPHTREIARRDKAFSMTQIAASRTPAEHIQMLDERLGVGCGAKKERAKLELIGRMGSSNE